MADVPTVFIVPPNNSLKCPIHQEVFREPVIAPCGCTFCKSCIHSVLDILQECPVHGTSLTVGQLKPNDNAKAIVDDLLIYCKGGVQRSVSGEYVFNPSGCHMWVSLGKRREHEDACPFAAKCAPLTPAIENKHPVPSSHVQVRTCMHHEQGCLFVGHTEQEAQLHQIECGYARLLKQIEQLNTQLVMKDYEIFSLREQLEMEKTKGLRLPNLPNINNLPNIPKLPDIPNLSDLPSRQQIVDSLTKQLEKLDEESTRLFSEAKVSLLKTRTAVKNSYAFQQSMQALSNIKEAVESAQNEIISRLQDLFDDKPDEEDIVGPTVDENNNNNTEIPVHTPQPPIDNASDIAARLDFVVVDDSEATVLNEDNQTPQAAPAVASSEQESEEEELKRILEASKNEYIQLQANRMAEEEQIRQALRISLIDYTTPKTLHQG